MNSFGSPECSVSEKLRRLRAGAPAGASDGGVLAMFLVRAEPPNFA